MNNIARDNILRKLRSSPRKKSISDANTEHFERFSWNKSEKIQHFCDVTRAVNTQVHFTTETSWTQDLAEILTKKQVRHLMHGQIKQFTGKLTNDWNDLSSHPELQCYDHSVDSCKDSLFHVDASITTTRGAIAQTGSLILWPTKEEPRLLSLTPPIHVCLVQSDDFFNTFAEVVEKQAWVNDMPTNALLISGPSKTADIEQELCYGVHGPKELIVFIIA